MSEEKGHISKEKWVEQGRDPDQWRSPEDWKERGEKILPIVKERLDKMTKDFAEVKTDLKASREAFSEFQEFQSTARKADAKRAYQDALRDIQTQQRAAVGDMDTEKYTELEGKKGELYQQYVADTKEPEKKEKPAAKPEDKFTAEEQERGQEFIKSNAWFNTDPVMKAYAQAQSVSLMDPKGNIDYDQLAKDVKARFPEKFTNPRRDDANLVEGGDTTKRNQGKKTFEDLPETAKKAYEKFKVQMPKFTKEEYLADYHG